KRDSVFVGNRQRNGEEAAILAVCVGGSIRLRQHPGNEQARVRLLLIGAGERGRRSKLRLRGSEPARAELLAFGALNGRAEWTLVGRIGPPAHVPRKHEVVAI